MDAFELRKKIGVITPFGLRLTDLTEEETLNWKNHYALEMELARREREEKLRQRAFRRVVRKHISEEQWKSISEEWANVNNLNRGADQK